MEDVLSRLVEEVETGKRVALASLVWSSGSIPMSDRAKMLVLESGELIGTIGGGCLEADVYAAGQQVLKSGEPYDMRYTMTEKQAGESGLNCGGTVRIYTELISPEGTGALYAKLLEVRSERKGCVLATELNGVSRALWGEGHQLLAGEGTEFDRCLESEIVDEVVSRGRGRTVADASGQREFFVEPFFPEPVLFVFGGGHVGGQVATLAKNVGFRVVLIDDRPAFANPQRHPSADTCLAGEILEIFPQLAIDDQSYILALTRGHQYDEEVVEQAVGSRARYIGMLGSERKKMVLWKRLRQRGISERVLERVYAPVGANIGADTPEEIAVSIVAELVKVRRGVRKVWKTKKQDVDV